MQIDFQSLGNHSVITRVGPDSTLLPRQFVVDGFLVVVRDALARARSKHRVLPRQVRISFGNLFWDILGT